MVLQAKHLLPALAVSSLSFASPTQRASLGARATYPGYDHPSNGVCTDYTINQTITFSALVWSYPEFKDNYDLAQWMANITSKDSMTVFQPFGNPPNMQDFTDTYEIAGTFCSPKTVQGGKETTVLIATHGFGFDRRYWAPTYKPEDYSFAQNALEAGYSIFYYDRLGVGQSSRISGFLNQGSPQIELLASITEAIRNGSYTGDIEAEKTVQVGHSYGSSIANGVIAQYPELVDAAIITGFSYPGPGDIALQTPVWIPSAWASRIAKTITGDNAPQYADTFDTGYFSFGDIYGYAETFFWQPDYDVDVAEQTFRVTQPTGVVEFITSALINLKSPGYVDKKILLTDGEHDLILCDGECRSVYRDGIQNETFPNTQPTIYIQDNAGHGQNFAKNVGTFYDVVFKFLDEI